MIIVHNWDNILGHFGHIFGLFGPKNGLFGSKIGLFGSKNGLFGQFLGFLDQKTDFPGKNGQMGFLLNSAALRVIFCVSRFTNTIS
jgi:hypothetical protein